MSFLFKDYSFVKVKCLLIRCCKTWLLLGNINNTNRNEANIQNTHTPNTRERKHWTLERVNKWYTHFCKTTPTILTILHFLREKCECPPPPSPVTYFSKISKTHPSLFIKGKEWEGGSNYKGFRTSFLNGVTK